MKDKKQKLDPDVTSLLNNKNAKHSQSARSYRFCQFETIAEKERMFDSIEPVEPLELIKPVEPIEPVEQADHVKLVELFEKTFQNIQKPS